ncbi:MAG: hypothetical protein K6C94_00360 [Candidatus Gastranaerophilales bacterium]|nr:hypothetical protein [Candidatus Gastranaerophilales bacterium]
MSDFLSTTAEDKFSEIGLQAEISEPLIKGLVKYSEEAVAITDNNFRIIYTNRDFFRKGENLFTKFKLKKKHINTSSFDIKRSIIVDKSICPFLLNIIKIASGSKNYYLFFAKKNLFEKEPDTAQLSLVNYLKHDLKTYLYSQIIALNVLAKNTNNDVLLSEILEAAETSYRIFKNHLNEFDFQTDNLTIYRKETGIMPIFEEIKKDCEKYAQTKNKVINLIRVRNSKIYADSKRLKDALLNILCHIGKLTEETSEIKISTAASHGMFKITIEFPHGSLDKNTFAAKTETSRFYTRDNGLCLSEKIIALHSGKIKIENKGKKSFIKIYMPK